MGLSTLVTQIAFDMWVALAGASHRPADSLKAAFIIPLAVEVTAQQGLHSVLAQELLAVTAEYTLWCYRVGPRILKFSKFSLHV